MRGGCPMIYKLFQFLCRAPPSFSSFFSIFFFHTLGRRRSGKSCQFRHRLRGSSSSGSIDLGLKSKDIRDRADGRVIGRWNPPTNTENNASHLLFFPPSSSSPKQLFRAFFFILQLQSADAADIHPSREKFDLKPLGQI